VSTINGVFFSFFLLSAWVTFLTEGVFLGFWNYAWGFNSQNYKIRGEKNVGNWNGGKIDQTSSGEKIPLASMGGWAEGKDRGAKNTIAPVDIF
jgi:hypothetical protein